MAKYIVPAMGHEDAEGRLSAEKVLEAVGEGSIVPTRRFDQSVHVEQYFKVPWNEEHGIEVQFDADGGILRYG